MTCSSTQGVPEKMTGRKLHSLHTLNNLLQVRLRVPIQFKSLHDSQGTIELPHLYRRSKHILQIQIHAWIVFERSYSHTTRLKGTAREDRSKREYLPVHTVIYTEVFLFHYSTHILICVRTVQPPSSTISRKRSSTSPTTLGTVLNQATLTSGITFLINRTIATVLHD